MNGADTATPTVYYVHTDHLMRPARMVAQNGTWVWDAIYAPFGGTAALFDATLRLDMRFPGQWFQMENGLAYNWHRHYDATLGRYVQPDPIGYEGGRSLYGYVGQNSLGYTDPEGLDVRVCYFPNAANGAGHVGLGIEDGSGDTFGFYPKHHSPNPKAVYGDGEIIRDNIENKQCKIIKTTKEQDECVKDCIDHNQLHPGSYSLVSRQCTGFVRHCIKACKIDQRVGNHDPWPENLFEALK